MQIQIERPGPQDWLIEAPSPVGFAPLNDVQSGPLAMFSHLVLPPSAISYVNGLTRHDLVRFESHQSHTVSGWHHNPAASVAARENLTNYLDHALPRSAGKVELIGALAGTYSQLAAGLDTSVLSFELRSRVAQNFPYTEMLHTDSVIGLEKTSIVYLRGPRSIFAHTRDIPPTDKWAGIIVTPELHAKLAAPPALSVAAWRGDDNPAQDPNGNKPAWHGEPYLYPGEDRFIIVSRVYSKGHVPGSRQPALR